MMKKTIFMLVIIVLTSSIFAETIILKDGRNFEGKIVGKNEGYLYLQTDKKIYKINYDGIETIKNNAEQPVTTIFLRKKDFIKDFDLNNIEEITINKTDILDKTIKNGKYSTTDLSKKIIINNIDIDTLNIRYLDIMIPMEHLTNLRKYWKFKAYVNYGQKIPNYPFEDSLLIKNEVGNIIIFNSYIELLNYFNKHGWEYVRYYKDNINDLPTAYNISAEITSILIGEKGKDFKKSSNILINHYILEKK